MGEEKRDKEQKRDIEYKERNKKKISLTKVYVCTSS
jgi:hypothetical protein